MRPHGHDTGRRDDEERACPVLSRMRDQGQGLQRLAQTHVIGEDPAEPGLPQEREPAETVELVGPQLGLDPGRFDLRQTLQALSLIHISEPTRRTPISYAV